jgi:hypothetical protein
MAQNTTLKEFEAVYPKLEEAILEHARKYKLPEGELSWLKAVSDSPHFLTTGSRVCAVFFFLFSRKKKA